MLDNNYVTDEENNKVGFSGNQNEEIDSQEIIDGIPEYPEFNPDPLFRRMTGIVVSSHEGFCFINEIKSGYATVQTNGDVFYPAPFPKDSVVEMTRLISDPEREGRFRAENAWIVLEETSLVQPPSNQLTIVQVVRDLSSMKSGYHSSAKNIPEEDVAQAAANEPFGNLLLGGHFSGSNNTDDISSAFMKKAYPAFESMGVNFSLNETEGFNEEEEAHRIEQIAAECGEELQGQADSLRTQYAEFRGSRNIFSLMHQKNLLKMENIIPLSYLPEVLAVAPVWYVDGKQSLPDTTGNDDPQPDHATQFFCDAVGSKEFAWLYQIYNRRNRRIANFSGRDLMPPHLMQIARIARQTFDYTVIATPYHDLASTEWANPDWLRLIDPFLFGFSKNLPYMFLLGRWSGTGLFPMVCDMIADTINHIRINKGLLKKFPCNAFWYKGGLHGNDTILELGRTGDNSILPSFANHLINAYEDGDLFPFLRGELSNS